ncbi:uncharacterized protein [Apostichopus japonicus]|uniref:uncharacterized protein n=1 Tax=Stichopus japonicus TaxID=307972 RepID=UPI003AB3ACC5
MPINKKLLKPGVISKKKIQGNLEKRQASQMKYYNIHTKPLPEFEVGESVKMHRNGKWYPVKVTSVANTPRSYVVTTSDGNSYRRNRRALAKTQVPTCTETHDYDEVIDTTEENSCDKSTQCFLDEARVTPVSCINETAGKTAHPCHDHNTKITCSCKRENHKLSRRKNSYQCGRDEWENGLYNLHCLHSPCDAPAPPDDFVFHSPNFTKGEMYPNGTEIMYDCPDGLDLNGHMTAVCLYGVWTNEDAYCTGSPCENPAPANVDVIVTPQNGEDEGKSGSSVSYSCPNGFILHGSSSAVCLYGRWIVETVPSCSAVCSKSTDCKSEQKSACDRKTRSCACPPGKTFQNGKCLVERIIRSSLQLEVAYKDDFANKSSCTFLLREQKIFTAFEETFTRFDDKCNSWFVSCKVEAIRKLNVTTILADVVTRYDEGVAMVTPEDFDTLIQSEAQSGLRLISITSEEGSYNACKEGTDICDPENGYCIYHNGTNYECRCKKFTIDRNQCNPAWHGIECASQCCAPANLSGFVIRIPDFAEGKMYPNGTEIMYYCPDRWYFKANIFAVCLDGVWTYEDACCIGL